MSRRIPAELTRRTLAGSVMSVAVALIAVATAAGASAPKDQHHDGFGYFPPPVQEAGPVTGAFTNVSKRDRHEVWLVDQSNTDPASSPSFGGRIHIFDGGELRTDPASAGAEVVELSAGTADLCRSTTGANPVRPHMIYFNSTQSHAVLSFVASGHVVIFEADSREPVACFRSEVGAGGARQAHAAVPTPDDRYILVANQNGKKVERISTDYATSTFSQDPDATLDLSSGHTPQGDPVETRDDARVRPDNAPICLFVPQNGFPAFVSLRGGGLFAVDPTTTPISIVADYPATEVARDGCGFTESEGWVYGNGGRPANALSGWFIYRVPVGGPELWNPTDQPAIELIQQDKRGPRDAHGMVTVRDRYVWAFDRSAHVLQVFEARSGRPGQTLNLRSPASQSPAPDITAQSPDGRAVYAATRGPNPLSGAHAADGDAPGVLVIEVRKDGREGAVRGHAAVSNLVGGVEMADPHGLAVRTVG
jgi:DNA-binding beta-propeller fold protein YncE